MLKLDQKFWLNMGVIKDDDLRLLIPKISRDRAFRTHDENSPPLSRQVVQEKSLTRSRRSGDDSITRSGLEPLDVAVTADRLTVNEGSARGRHHRERSRLASE